MKNISKQSLIVILIIIGSFPHFGYSQESDSTRYSELIIGKWTLDFDESLEKANDQTKARFNGKEVELKSIIRSNFDQQILQFKDDGTFSVKPTGENKFKGTWTIQEGQDILVVVWDNEQESEWVIKKVNSEILIINLGEDQIESSMFKKWIYTKAE